MDDDNFHQGISEISQEPVPYFRQLCETQYTTSSRPSSASSQSSNQSSSSEEFGGELEQIPQTTQVIDISFAVGCYKTNEGFPLILSSVIKATCALKANKK